MAIAKTSRYMTGRILHEPATDTVMVLRTSSAPTSNFSEHVWSDADRLDLLASRYLGNAQYWWKIMDANPFIQEPSSIRPGMIIRIPNS